MADDSRISSRVSDRYQLKRALAQADRVWEMRRIARERQNFPNKVVSEAFQRAGGKCQGCGRVLAEEDRGSWDKETAWQADHKDDDPMNNAPANCQILCSECHLKKTFPDAPAE